MAREIGGVKYHPNWMRIMYGLTAVFAGVFGLALLITPSATESFMGFPTQEPMIAGVAYSVWFTLGVLSIFGLRSPLKFAPVLVAEVFYKSAWILVLVVPRAVAGTLPSFAMITTLEWLLIPILGNIIAVPWRYVFAKS
ncbi:MAG: hypothetical protein ACE14S_07570 [Candidatus Bathyarchaeia archaeon]